MKAIPYLLTGLCLLSGAGRSHAQAFTPVFEHLYTGSTPLPILKAQGSLDEADDRFDGTAPMDSYGGFHRYSTNRLLLAIRENGINESVAGHDAALAAAYPDRSLIWINPETGAPMGLALKVGLQPMPLDADFTAKGGTLNDFYFSFGVAEDGVVFTGYKNKILRFVPDGNGGFTGPTMAYTHADDNSANWHQWRWENFRVKGAGAQTVILAGGKTWRPNQGYHVLTTADGVTFTKTDPAQNVAAGGGASSLISGRVAGEADTDWVYTTAFPGSSNGTDSRFNRRVGDAETGAVFANDGLFGAQRDTNAVPELEYVTEFISDVDGDDSLGYVVAYSTPSWNSKAVNRLPARPGFLALHAHDGSVLGSRTLNVKEDSEIVGDPAAADASSQFHGTLGAVEVNVLPGMKAGQSEVLWYSGIYGFGRYLVQGPPITPVFEHLYTGSTPLPILKAQGSLDEADDRFDGTAPMDSYGGFHRYSTNRLLLAIRENGINESVAGHDAALAAAYPDRSLIWINPETGAPMGLALKVGLQPMPLDADFTAKGGTLNDFYFSFGVAEDGVVFTGYKNKILRFVPDGNGGFTGPTMAYTHADDNSANWHQWRWENFRVKGAGAQTVILAGGKTWRPNQGYHVLTTADGVTFTKTDPAQNVAAGGGASSLISGRVAGEADTDWVYTTAFPGSSNGTDSRFNRRVGDAETGAVFANDGLFGAQRDMNAVPELEYVTEFISDVDGDDSLGYVVAYSTPSWNSKAVNRLPARPGFLALHAHDGSVLGSRTLNVKEDSEIVGDPAAADASSQFHGTLGAVEVNVLPGMKAGQSEILWYSGIYGYGRYLVSATAATGVPAALIVKQVAGGIELSWTGDGTLESSDTLGGSWTPVTGAKSPVTAPNAGAANYYRLRI